MNFKKFIANNPLTKSLISQKTKEEVQNYWRNPNDPEYNSPEVYLKSKTKNTKILVDIANQYFNDKKIKVLELGCNVGRNLNALFQDGFKNLYAIEINSEAIKLMEKSFPETFSCTKILEGTIEDKIKEIENEEFDLVFTMAVLMHVHYDSNWIFEHISRITKKYLIVMEHEKGLAKKNFPRNYKVIFEKLGLEEVKALELDDGYICRIFIKKNK